MSVTIKKVQKALNTLKGVIKETNLIYSNTFSEICNNQIYLKPENLQKTGSFKIRGAYNKIAGLPENERENSNGVIASSAGNHAQGVAYAATHYGIKSTIVMPREAPIAKVTATKNYGAEVVLHGDSYDEAYNKARSIQRETESVFVHPFDDEDVIAGQGTISLEILEELPDTDIIVVPIGGGGLISGMALAAKSICPEIKIVGVEAAGASIMRESLKKGQIDNLDKVSTIADGIAVKKPGKITFDLCKKYLDEIVTVDEEEIANAILMLLERTKMVVEGAGATSLAALLNNKIGNEGKKIVALLSGGNIDVNVISRIIERGLIKADRRMTINTRVKDKPGNLQKLLSIIAELGANVISITHNHSHPGVPINDAMVKLELEVKDKEHSRRIVTVLSENGYIMKF
ncbi:MAG: threonine ammonia-lyase [Halanaerobiales bacterium]